MRTSCPTFELSTTLAQITQRSPMVESMIWLPALDHGVAGMAVIPRSTTLGSIVTSGLDLHSRLDEGAAGILRT